MASGQPFLSTDIDEWLYALLSADPLLQTYAPGGFWASHPDQVVNNPWSGTATYNLGDTAVGADDQPYRSLVDGNAGNDPTSTIGFWSRCFPCVRWWVQSPGMDTKRQDGTASRALSNPNVVVCMLDRQRGGVVDLVGGTNGHLKDGALRLVTLLDGTLRGFTTADGRSIQFGTFVNSAYGPTIEPDDGDNLVLVGHWYQLRVQ